MANPYKAALPHLERQGEFYGQTLNPYIERGNAAGQQATDIYSSMAGNPAEHYQKWAATYNPRRGYEGIKNDERYRNAREEARAGGYAGTEYDRDRRERLANELQDENFDRYMNYIMGIEKSGLEGQTHFSDFGQHAGENYAELMGNNYGERGELAFKSAELQNRKKNQLLQALLGTAGTIGGAFLGGPAGASIGGALGSSLAGGYSGGNSLDSGSWNTSKERSLPGFNDWMNSVGNYGR